MSLSELISLKGLITVTVGSLLTVKAMRITWNISRNNVNINGSYNNVNIVEGELSKVRQSFALVWNVLAVLLFATYPIWGVSYNSVLTTAAVFGVPLSIVALVVTIMGFGWKRISDLWYVIGVAIACWLVVCAAPYLPDAAESARQFGVIIVAVREYGLSAVTKSQYAGSYLRAFYYGLSELLGLVLLFLSFGYLLFSFLRERSFDAALRRTGLYTLLCGLGYLLVGGFLVNQDISHLEALFSAAIPFLYN